MELINSLKNAGWRLTVYDIGNKGMVMFCLGVIVDDATDLIYLGRHIGGHKLDCGLCAVDGHIAYFPEQTITRTEYALICAL